METVLTSKPLDSSQEFPAISIVINTMNRALFLPKTLRSLRYLDYPNFEVIVVVGPCTDNTEDVLREFKGDIRLAYCPEANLSRSRNIGIREARGDIVVFIDDDGIPIPEWLNRIVPEYRDPAVAAVGGWVMNHTGSQYQAKYVTHERTGLAFKSVDDLPLEKLCYPHAAAFPGLVGVNSSFRRSYLYQICGFDEWFRYFLDETDVLVRLVDRGYRIACVPDALVHHKGAPSNMRNYYLISRSELYFALQNRLPWISKEEMEGRISTATQLNIQGAVDYDQAMKTNTAPQVQAEINRGHVEARDFCSHMPYRLLGLRDQKPSSGPLKKYPRLGNEERLRICMITQEYPPRVNGGNAVQAKEAARGLAARGHFVNVITKSPELHTVDWEDGVWIHQMPLDDLTTLPCPHGIVAAPHITALSNAMLKAVKSISSLHKLDAVAAHIWDCEGLGILTKTELPLVTHLETTYLACKDHQPAWNANPSFMKNHVLPTIECEKLILRNSTRLHAISRAILNEVISGHGIEDAESRAALVPIGLADRNPGGWQPPLQRDFIEGLFVGRLEKRKGIDTLLAVLPTLLGENPKLRMTIAGDASIPGEQGKPYRDVFLEQYASAPWIDRVHFKGKISDIDLDAAYRSCDFFVGPSRFESFGIVFVEAMMFAKPVVACRAGGVPEVVEHGVTGLLAAPSDPQNLLEALRQIMSEDLRSKLGSAGRARYEKLFHIDRMVDGMEKLYFDIRRETHDAAHAAKRRSNSLLATAPLYAPSSSVVLTPPATENNVRPQSSSANFKSNLKPMTWTSPR